MYTSSTSYISDIRNKIITHDKNIENRLREIRSAIISVFTQTLSPSQYSRTLQQVRQFVNDGNGEILYIQLAHIIFGRLVTSARALMDAFPRDDFVEMLHDTWEHFIQIITQLSSLLLPLTISYIVPSGKLSIACIAHNCWHNLFFSNDFLDEKQIESIMNNNQTIGSTTTTTTTMSDQDSGTVNVPNVASTDLSTSDNQNGHVTTTSNPPLNLSTAQITIRVCQHIIAQLDTVRAQTSSSSSSSLLSRQLPPLQPKLIFFSVPSINIPISLLISSADAATEMVRPQYTPSYQPTQVLTDQDYRRYDPSVISASIRHSIAYHIDSQTGKPQNLGTTAPSSTYDIAYTNAIQAHNRLQAPLIESTPFFQTFSNMYSNHIHKITLQRRTSFLQPTLLRDAQFDIDSIDNEHIITLAKMQNVSRLDDVVLHRDMAERQIRAALGMVSQKYQFLAQIDLQAFRQFLRSCPPVHIPVARNHASTNGSRTNATRNTTQVITSPEANPDETNSMTDQTTQQQQQPPPYSPEPFSFVNYPTPPPKSFPNNTLYQTTHHITDYINESLQFISSEIALLRSYSPSSFIDYIQQKCFTDLIVESTACLLRDPYDGLLVHWACQDFNDVVIILRGLTQYQKGSLPEQIEQEILTVMSEDILRIIDTLTPHGNGHIEHTPSIIILPALHERYTYWVTFIEKVALLFPSTFPFPTLSTQLSQTINTILESHPNPVEYIDSYLDSALRSISRILYATNPSSYELDIATRHAASYQSLYPDRQIPTLQRYYQRLLTLRQLAYAPLDSAERQEFITKIDQDQFFLEQQLQHRDQHQSAQTNGVQFSPQLGLFNTPTDVDDLLWHTITIPTQRPLTVEQMFALHISRDNVLAHFHSVLSRWVFFLTLNRTYDVYEVCHRRSCIRRLLDQVMSIGSNPRINTGLNQWYSLLPDQFAIMMRQSNDAHANSVAVQSHLSTIAASSQNVNLQQNAIINSVPKLNSPPPNHMALALLFCFNDTTPLFILLEFYCIAYLSQTLPQGFSLRGHLNFLRDFTTSLQTLTFNFTQSKAFTQEWLHHTFKTTPGSVPNDFLSISSSQTNSAAPRPYQFTSSAYVSAMAAITGLNPVVRRRSTKVDDETSQNNNNNLNSLVTEALSGSLTKPSTQSQVSSTTLFSMDSSTKIKNSLIYLPIVVAPRSLSQDHPLAHFIPDVPSHELFLSPETLRTSSHEQKVAFQLKQCQLYQSSLRLPPEVALLQKYFLMQYVQRYPIRRFTWNYELTDCIISCKFESQPQIVRARHVVPTFFPSIRHQHSQLLSNATPVSHADINKTLSSSIPTPRLYEFRCSMFQLCIIALFNNNMTVSIAQILERTGAIDEKHAQISKALFYSHLYPLVCSGLLLLNTPTPQRSTTSPSSDSVTLSSTDKPLLYYIPDSGSATGGGDTSTMTTTTTTNKQISQTLNSGAIVSYSAGFFQNNLENLPELHLLPWTEAQSNQPSLGNSAIIPYVMFRNSDTLTWNDNYCISTISTSIPRFSFQMSLQLIKAVDPEFSDNVIRQRQNQSQSTVSTTSVPTSSSDIVNITTASQSKQEHETKRILLGRSKVLDGAVIRIMKKNQRLSYDELFQLVQNHIKLFPVDADFFKERIEALIVDYEIDRDENDPSFIVYAA